MAAKKQPKKSVAGGRGKAVPPAKRVSSKPKPMTGPQKVATKKAMIASKRNYGTSVSLDMVKNPAKYTAANKVKNKPYDAKWKSEVKRKTKAYDNSIWHKVVEPASQIFGQLYAIERVSSAIAGRDLSKPRYDKKGNYLKAPKTSRLGAAAEAAFAVAPLKGKKIAKTIKAAKTARQAKTTYKFVKDAKIGKKQVAVTRNKKKALYG